MILNKVKETTDINKLEHVQQRYLALKNIFDFVKKEMKELETQYIQTALLKKVDEFELSVRVMNALKNDNIKYLGDLVTKTDGEILRMPNFGRKSLNEVKQVLKDLDLETNMNVLWPPQIINLEEQGEI